MAIEACFGTILVVVLGVRVSKHGHKKPVALVEPWG